MTTDPGLGGGKPKKEKKGNNTTPTKKDERLAFVCLFCFVLLRMCAHMGRIRKRLGSKYAGALKLSRPEHHLIIVFGWGAGRIFDWTKKLFD